MTTLLLVRHGETDWNAEGRLQGHTDRPLNDHGRRQAAALAERLADDEIDAVYASDLARARETAEILAGRLGLPVVTDPDLRERNWGNWEGLTGTERDRVDYVGEDREAHGARVIQAVRRIAEHHPGERVVVVTHGGSLRRIQVAAYGMALPVIENCSVWAVAHEDGRFRPID
ncbi:MAG: 2,3-bisphosphoglycerate-dependent phosphoglycerate mutase [Gaiellaceae bacterium]|nr:2,3-bisphosphoglycerate-dependent phosphoglycerate mutase [Gaiellaceae bacterium]